MATKGGKEVVRLLMTCLWVDDMQTAKICSTTQRALLVDGRVHNAVRANADGGVRQRRVIHVGRGPLLRLQVDDLQRRGLSRLSQADPNAARALVVDVLLGSRVSLDCVSAQRQTHQAALQARVLGQCQTTMTEPELTLYLQNLLVDVGGIRQREDAVVDQQLAVAQCVDEVLFGQRVGRGEDTLDASGTSSSRAGLQDQCCGGYRQAYDGAVRRRQTVLNMDSSISAAGFWPRHAMPCRLGRHLHCVTHRNGRVERVGVGDGDGVEGADLVRVRPHLQRLQDGVQVHRQRADLDAVRDLQQCGWS